MKEVKAIFLVENTKEINSKEYVLKRLKNK